MKEVLGITFDLLEKGELLPLVHKSNNSNLATLIRDSIKLSRVQTSRDVKEQRDAMIRGFEHWHENTLECVIEIGLCKVKRDYIHYMVGDDTVDFEQLGFIWTRQYRQMNK